MKIKALCGAIVTVAAATGGAALATSINANGEISLTQVKVYTGSEAQAFLPAYRELLNRQASSNTSDAAGATDSLNSLDKTLMQSFTVTVSTPVSESSIGSGTLSANSIPVEFPLNPVYGQVATFQGSYMQGSYMYAETDSYQYDSSTGQWISNKHDVDRVTTCPFGVS